MTVEEDIASMKTDIKWIRERIHEFEDRTRFNRGYVVAIIASVLISVSSIIIGLVR